MMLLYQYTAAPEKEEFKISEYAIKVFQPNLFSWKLPKERLSIKTLLVRMMFYAITWGKARVVYATSESGDIMHTSYVIPKCIKFPFLQKYDYEIGPCVTNPQYRGRGIYPNVINYICGHFAQEGTVFYMIVNANNTPSIRGIEKAGFEKCGTVEKSGLLKAYQKSTN